MLLPEILLLMISFFLPEFVVDSQLFLISSILVISTCSMCVCCMTCLSKMPEHRCVWMSITVYCNICMSINKACKNMLARFNSCLSQFQVAFTCETLTQDEKVFPSFCKKLNLA